VKATAKKHNQRFEKSREEQMVKVNIINGRGLCDKTLENATVPGPAPSPEEGAVKHESAQKYLDMRCHIILLNNHLLE
jgi:hypothetical protein